MFLTPTTSRSTKSSTSMTKNADKQSPSTIKRNKTNIMNLKKPELISELEKHGLGTRGKIQTLRKRLSTFLKNLAHNETNKNNQTMKVNQLSKEKRPTKKKK